MVETGAWFVQTARKGSDSAESSGKQKVFLQFYTLGAKICLPGKATRFKEKL